MQLIISCAKDMTAHVQGGPKIQTQPLFEQQAIAHALQLAQYSVEDLQKILQCSSKIALQNKMRYMHFLDQSSKLPAALAYSGVAFKHLNAVDFTDDEVSFANSHLWITSFLYGLLRPMDAISPYRLEGKIKLPDNGGKTMFDYWKPILTDTLIKAVNADDGCLVYLATEEMTHLFDWKRVKERITVIEPRFLTNSNGNLKLVTVYAKMCRGALARYIVKNKIKDPADLCHFSYNGFAFTDNYTWILE